MRYPVIRLSLLGAIAVVSACASSPVEETSAPDPVTATPADGALVAQGLAPAVTLVPRSGIGPQTLESGDCALFLWSKTDASQFIFFQKAGSGTARLRIGDETVDAPQTFNRGEVFGQFMTEQAFITPSAETVQLAFQPGEELQSGQRIDSGRLTITAEQGWRTVIPVLGVRACQP